LTEQLIEKKNICTVASKIRVTLPDVWQKRILAINDCWTRMLDLESHCV